MASLTTKIRNFMKYKYTLDSRTVAGVRKGGGGGGANTPLVCGLEVA